MGIASKIVKGGLEAVAKKARRAEDLERKAAEAYAQMPEYLQDPYLGLSTSNIGKVTKPLLQKAQRMSEALNPHVGKRLYITQADRTALDYDQGLLGGPGFVELAEIDPTKYKDVAWAVGKPQTATTMVNAMARNPEEAIWTNLIGSPEQHRSNQVVFDRIINQFQKAVQEDKLTPKLRETINKRLANLKDKDTGMNFFPKDVDILSPDFAEHTQTFHHRAMVADILSGKGVGGQKGTIIPYQDIIRETTDPLLVGAKTHDIGDRLFSLSGNIEENASLHPAFPIILKGRKESEGFLPAPKELVLEDYINKFMQENKGRRPGTMDLTRGYPPSVEVNEPMLERMYKEGYAGGGLAKKIAKKLAQELPEASASGKTPIATTVGTYRKASPILLEDIKDVNAPILDYGAGMGLGAEELRKTFPNVKTLEPFYEGKFDFTDPSKVPSGEFKGLTNFSVLNAVTPEVRDSIVENIGRVMDRGGVGLITARSPSAVMSTKGKLVDEPNAMITQKGTYQKGFDTDELREYIKYILGSDFEYEPLKGLSGTSVKVKKKADGGSIDEPEVLKEIPRGKISGKIADILKPASEFLGKYEVLPQIPLIGGTSVAELTGVEGIQTLADDISRGYRPIRNLERGKLQTSFFDPRLVDAVDLGTTALGGVGLAKNLGKTAIKEGMKQIETGTGMLGRNVMNPRMNVIKDQGGMLVGGEKALDDELIAIKKNENPYPHAHQYFVPEAERANLKDKNAVALNSWVDTKVKKYIRNQAGSEADPILKAIDSGVDYNFTPPQSGDTKYTIAMKRKLVGKDPQGIATTERGKDWEYTVDSIFNPVKSSEIKDILQRNKDLPPSEASDKFLASVLRMEHDLPVYNKKDLDALQLINQIPDETVYGLNPAITNKLGLNHMTDVIMSDLESGRLKPEQLNQMSMEKAVRRVAEFDAEQAKIASKAEADTIKDLPVYNTYDQGYKWIELNHPTDELITRKALTSESDQMGHCVGRLAKYREGIENGTKRIYSLRDANNKPHITIEEDIYRNPDAFVKANAETIANDPDLSKIKYSDDVDYRYGDARLTDDELNNNFIGELIRTMKKKGLPINEDPSTTYSIINQVKGKENTRPNEKYQSYLTDFLKNSPIKHEIAEIKELQNTNILDIDKIGQHGIVPKEVHFHPVVESAVKNYPKENILLTFGKLDMKPSKMEVDEAIKYQMFKDVAHDLAIQKNYYPTNEDVISHIKNKYLPTQKAKGGSINLNQEYKLENMRRRYG
jgi:hypothetical protein